jgi:hypothetical protein
MNKIYKLFFLLFIGVLATGCDPNGDSTKTKLRDFAEQRDKDMVDIELFLKTHSYTVVNNPGFVDDQNVTFTEVPSMDPTCIWLDAAHLKTRTVTKNDIDYTLYYLQIREGGGAANDQPYPTNADAVLTSYTGKYMFHSVETDEETGEITDSLKTYEFENVQYPQGSFNLEGVIRAWSEVFPQFKAGNAAPVNGQPTVYSDFGAGVMFVPSGLGYFNQAQGSIPAYSPLVFTFKLYSVTRLDQDGDGIPSYLEDLDGDRYMYVLAEDIENPDDTDGDLAPDYLDLDDDGDFTLTKVELRRPKQDPENEDEPWTYYKFNGDVTNDPLTWYDDTQGAPNCAGDFATPGRLRKYRDPSCH